jgi:hypothetical protein
MDFLIQGCMLSYIVVPFKIIFLNLISFTRTSSTGLSDQINIDSPAQTVTHTTEFLAILVSCGWLKLLILIL